MKSALTENAFACPNVDESFAASTINASGEYKTWTLDSGHGQWTWTLDTAHGQ